MGEAVQTFTFTFGDAVVKVRGAVREDGVKVFVAKDVVEGLDAVWNGKPCILHVKEAWRGVSLVLTPSGAQSLWVLTEQGINHYCMRSDKPRAVPFQEWIAGDVLPQIDRTGRYEQPQALPASPSTAYPRRPCGESTGQKDP
ncbi:Bro-N domain-containing protein [Paraburkholderia denitrificans]|uniref:Bro-N domain-containing protein n=1 Tax=Paraburkholderia denitrificans TaxID=694025 RepID=A0ABW0J3P3_9BURK